MAKKSNAEYYCIAVRRNYESVWRVIAKLNTQEEAQAELDARRGYKGAFNYDNAELRVISRTDAKVEFGAKWEYQPIGSTRDGAKAAKTRAKAKTKTATDE